MVDWNAERLLFEDLPPPLVPDRGGYTLTMRECRGAAEALASLAAGRGPQSAGPRLHVGWGSFRNLDIVAARRADAVLLLDINWHQFRVWAALSEALCRPEARTPAALVDLLVPLLPQTPPLRQFARSAHQWLRGDLERPGSWLWAEDVAGYEWVRERIRMGCMSTAALDLRGGAAGASHFARLAARLRLAVEQAGVVPDTLYVSNLPWMMGLPQGFFGERHSDHGSAGTEPVLQQVHHHLACLAPLFNWVVSAARLCDDATADNLQWETRVLTPEAFLAGDDWLGMANAIRTLGLTRV
ncbi:MAG TPA: hypothetical protein VFW84_11725 [Aquabacterium sp.]|uniref:hypothetical protein n=1 Tax=Aquabacterium sp. TaxID=1872578 RepID=UPI002E35DD40|nr:hypothetical protein [Aquabacterium sp.]HEX5373390.1 hypothetical protein [Aquabacterium sp.]